MGGSGLKEVSKDSLLIRQGAEMLMLQLHHMGALLSCLSIEYINPIAKMLLA